MYAAGVQSLRPGAFARFRYYFNTWLLKRVMYKMHDSYVKMGMGELP